MCIVAQIVLYESMTKIRPSKVLGERGREVYGNVLSEKHSLSSVTNAGEKFEVSLQTARFLANCVMENLKLSPRIQNDGLTQKSS